MDNEKVVFISVNRKHNCCAKHQPNSMIQGQTLIFVPWSNSCLTQRSKLELMPVNKDAWVVNSSVSLKVENS